MILSTTPNIEGKRILNYLGIVSGEAFMGANLFKDIFAAVRDIVGIDLDYENFGANGGMLMVSVSGTAVVTE